MEDEFYTGSWYQYGKGESAMMICPVCPNCKRFIKMGDFFSNDATGETRVKGFVCKRCGEIDPERYWKSECMD